MCHGGGGGVSFFFFFDIIPQIPNLLFIAHLPRAKLVDSVHFNAWDYRSTVLCDLYLTLIFTRIIRGSFILFFSAKVSDLISTFVSNRGPIGAYCIYVSVIPTAWHLVLVFKELSIWSTPMRGYYRNSKVLEAIEDTLIDTWRTLLSASICHSCHRTKT